MNTSKITKMKSRLSLAIDALQLIRKQKIGQTLMADVICLLKDSVVYGTFLLEMSQLVEDGVIVDLSPYDSGFNTIDDFCDIVEALQAQIRLAA